MYHSCLHKTPVTSVAKIMFYEKNRNSSNMFFPILKMMITVLGSLNKFQHLEVLHDSFIIIAKYYYNEYLLFY